MEQIQKLYRSLSVAQRLSIVIFAALFVGGTFWFTHAQREAGFRPLFSSLSPEDGAAIVQKLKETGVDYRIGENGASVLVPEARVAELRLELAGAGLPKTGRIGYEIFDKTNFGMTDFAEHVNYRRAVEGELERSIISIAEVEQARVHVTFPKDSVYLEAREPAKASVLVRLRPGAVLSPQNIAGITHLISSAVEGLAPTAVSVVDMQGTLLNRPKRVTSTDADTSDEALEYQQKLEHDLQAKIGATLEPLLGAEKFRTAVSVDCDMTVGEQSEEVFDPSKSVMVSSQRTEDGPNSATTAGGQPGTASNLPNAPAPEPRRTTGSARRVESIQYESSRTTRHLKLPQGTVKRLSIAVLVDNTVQWEGKGAQAKRILIPPAPEKLKTIHDLVATAVGLVPTRGDELTVESLPFDATLNSAPPTIDTGSGTKKEKKPAAVVVQEQLKSPIGIGAAAGVVGVVALLLMMRSRRKGKKPEIVTQETPALIAATVSRADSVTLSRAAQENTNTEAPRPQASQALQLPPSRAEVITGQLRDSVTRDAEAWAGVLRSWLAEEENA